MKNLVLGINLPMLPDGTITYDGNVALGSRDNVLMALTEERVSKKKYDGEVVQAVKEILFRNNVHINELEAVSIVSFAQPMDKCGASELLRAKIENTLGVKTNIHYVRSHHEAHALSAISQTSYNKALVVVADHTGNLLSSGDNSNQLEENSAEQTSYFLLEDNNLKLLEQGHDSPADQGYGRFYGDITCYLGFSSYRESGKTMGLASFGDPKVFEQYKPFIRGADGKVYSDLQNINYTEDHTKDFNAWFARHGLRLPASRQGCDLIRPFDMNLAAWAQNQIEISIIEKIKCLREKYNFDVICMSGGVAMNSVLNRRIEDELGLPVYIPPSPGDAGLAIGAIAEYFYRTDKVIPRLQTSAYLGPSYSEDEIKQAVSAYSTELDARKIENIEALAAEKIAEGNIVGWFQGRSEYGPRALGNRSIIALPKNSWMKEILNSQLKRREWFRPYAPVVLAEKVSLYFETKNPEPYMMKIARVTERAKYDMPACIHVDNTARLQTVTRDNNRRFYDLISEVEKITGAPLVLNTSFNLAGMPIVETPSDAITCFLAAEGMDYLFIGNYVLKKRQNIN